MNQSLITNSNRSDDSSLLIQTLVDGELDHSSRSDWLAGLSEDSPLWRDLALAFVEKQITDEALRDFPIADSATNDSIRSAGSIEFLPNASLNAHQSPSHSRGVMWILGLAACLLTGVFIGSEIGTSRTEPVVTQAVETSTHREDSNNGNEEPDIAIGLADALSRSGAPVPNEFRRALLKAGYSLRDKRTITNVLLPSGGQIELPVRDVDVTYVGLNSFQ